MSYQENCYNMSVILDSLITLLITQQKEAECLQDNTKCFQITRKVFESQSGRLIILMKPLLDNKACNQYATDMQEHEKNEIFQQQAFKQMLAFTYLVHGDQTKYGSILTSLITQQSLRNDQYPKTISEANNVLSNHKFDITKFDNKNPNNNGNIPAKHEPEQDKINLSFVQLEGKCFCCGKMGHKLHSANSRINQRQNGLSTKANKAMLKQAKQNPRFPNLC
jgi:hypothetical protein